MAISVLNSLKGTESSLKNYAILEIVETLEGFEGFK